MSNNISLYPRITETKNSEDIPVDILLDRIKTGYWQDAYLKVRAAKTEEEQRAAKRTVPYVTISGRFAERKDSAIISHSGFIAIDIDDVDPDDTKSFLCADQYVYACFTSISGTGLCAIFKINAERHLDAFYGISEYLLKEYGIIVDAGCKDVSRARFVSWDQGLYVNNKADKFAKYPKKEDKKAQTVPEVVFVQSDFDEIVQEIVQRRVDITGDYRQWLKCCFAIVDKFGENGRQFFHAVSQFGAYDPKITDRQYTNCIKAGRSGITIASFYYLAKQAGINTVSAQTKIISQHAALSKKNRVSKESAIKKIEELEGIGPEVSGDIVDQIYSSNIKVDTSESPIEAWEIWLRQNYEFKRNVITRYIEDRGRQLDEIYLNTIKTAAAKVFEKLNDKRFENIIYSDFTPNYNPLIEFLNTHKDRNPAGAIDALMGSISTDTGMGEGQFCPDYAQRFFKKWMVGVVAGIFDDNYNRIQLVLTGGQNIGKSRFFRDLLPKELKDYFGETRMEHGKDDLFLMTEKLILMNDERDQNNRKEDALWKAIISKQKFSLAARYSKGNADYRRLASLAGTQNPDEVLTDISGNSRIVPIKVNSIDFEKINAVDRIDVLIEAYHLYLSGFDWKLSPEDVKILGENTAEFVDESAESHLLHRYFEKPESQGPGGNNVFMTTSEIKAAIHSRTGENNLNKNRIGAEMKKAGWIVKAHRRYSGATPSTGYWVIGPKL